MSTGTTPPSRRVAAFLDRRRGHRLGDPSGGRSVGWLISRLGIAAGLAFLAWVIGWYVLFSLSCACTPPPSPPRSPLEGVVVSVDSAGLGDVRGFDLRTQGGATYAFTLGPLENATAFSPSHLAAHQASSEPVRVFFRVERGGSSLIVYRLEDAPRPPVSPAPSAAGAT